jgi:nucleoid-associated protein YgaU
MIDTGVRIAAASTVLLGGILLALLFRHQSPSTGPPPPETGDRLVLRKRIEPQHASEAASRRGAARDQRATSGSAASAASGREPTLLKPTTLKPMSPGEPPPVLARDYPGNAVPEGEDETASPGRRPAGIHAEARSPRVHKVADGDTLRALADRYLGSADRFGELYEANRDLLPSPEILPIGVELKIPAGQRPRLSPSNFMPKCPLVPVASGKEET